MLKTQGKGAVQDAKRDWAKNIAPLMTVEANKSPSFQEFYSNIVYYTSSYQTEKHNPALH